jgi:Fe-S-cluster-containing hydrogenase component 2
MAYVIAEPCVATCSRECVDVCPVDAIHGPARLQLYIDPETCTSCSACQAVCPASAIFDVDELPPQWAHYRELNETLSKENGALAETAAGAVSNRR